jgi:arabinogalactan endo-1,4-beta-galactosidase
MFTSPNNKTALRFRRNPYDLEGATDGGGTEDSSARMIELEERNRELGKNLGSSLFN